MWVSWWLNLSIWQIILILYEVLWLDLWGCISCLFFFFYADGSSSLITSYSHFPSSPSLPLQRFQALSSINRPLLTTKTNPIKASHSTCQSVDIEEQVDGICSSSYVSVCAQILSRASSCKSVPTDGQSWVSDEASSSSAFNDCNSNSCESQVIYLLFALSSCQFKGWFHMMLMAYLSILSTRGEITYTFCKKHLL